jgi:hypothetical protein
LVLNSGFWNGYVAYQVGLMIFILYLCQSDERRTDPLVIFLFSVLLFFAHGLIYATFCLTCGMYCLYNRKIWAPAVAILPSVFLLAWYVWANDVSLINKPFALSGIVQFVTYKIYTAMKAGPYQDFIFHGVGDSQRLRPLYVLGILANLFFLIALVMCCASVVWKEGAKEIARRAELVSSFILMGIFLALPATLTGVVNPGERLLYPALILAACALFKEGRAGYLFGYSLGATVIAGLFISLASITAPRWMGVNGVSAVAIGPADLSAEVDGRELFGHRLMQFDEKMQEAQRSWKVRDMPRLPLGFNTALLDDRVVNR